MSKSIVLLLAIVLPVAASPPPGAIRPETPSAPESQDASGHEINELYVDFVDNVIDDAHWPGEGGVDLLYLGYFGFGVVDNFVSSAPWTEDSGWRVEYRYDDSYWPTEVPWGDVPPRYGDENILYYMTDDAGVEPLGVRLRQHSFGFAGEPDEDFIYILWTVYNDRAGYLEDAAAGLYTDMDIGDDDYTDFTRYDLTHRFAYTFDGLSDFPLPYFVAATMGDEPTGSYHCWSQRETFDYRQEDEIYYTMLSQVGRFQELPEFFYDWRFLLGFQLHDLAPGEMRDYAVALVAGWGCDEIVENLAAARSKWDELFGGGVPEPSIPPQVTLCAPWPCPARDSASFEVELYEPGNIEVALYDVSGRLVETVYAGYMAAGRNELTVWTGALSPGVYLIRAAGEGSAAVRRLVVAR